MKDFCCYLTATNGQVGTLSGRMKEWADLSEYARKDIVAIFAKLALDAYHHPPPFCRFCLRDDCPSLKDKGDFRQLEPHRTVPMDRLRPAAPRV